MLHIQRIRGPVDKISILHHRPDAVFEVVRVPAVGKIVRLGKLGAENDAVAHGDQAGRTHGIGYSSSGGQHPLPVDAVIQEHAVFVHVRDAQADDGSGVVVEDHGSVRQESDALARVIEQLRDFVAHCLRRRLACIVFHHDQAESHLIRQDVDVRLLLPLVILDSVQGDRAVGIRGLGLVNRRAVLIKIRHVIHVQPSVYRAVPDVYIPSSVDHDELRGRTQVVEDHREIAGHVP